MFFKQTINKIKLLNKDKESYPDLAWLKKNQEHLRQFMVENPAVRKSGEKSHHIVERVNFTKLNAQESRQFAFLGLRLKPMPIIIPILIAATILTGGGLTAVQAQDALPGQTLYPVKLATEKVQLAFSGQEGDVKLHAKFASKRVGEIEELISQTPEQGSQTPEQGMQAIEIKAELIVNTASKLKQEVELSEKGLTALADKGEDVTELALKVEEAISNHLEVLAGLITNVPVQAQPALKQAYQVFQTGQVSAMEAIIKAGEKGYPETMKPLVEERVKVRLEEVKGKIEEAQSQASQAVLEESNPVVSETAVQEINQFIQSSETSLQQGNFSEAMEGIRVINVKINEIQTDASGSATLISNPDIDPSPTPRPVPIPPTSSQCEKLTGYSVKAYQEGWREVFQKENNLSDSQFNTYITVANATLQPIGNTCELTVRYMIKKDWVSVNRTDSMTLGVPPTISPNNLPLESDPTKSGRAGVSTINLHDSLSFKNKTEALNYFVNTYNLSDTDAGILKENFQYFWDKESAENSNYPFAGEGGEAYITVVGTINAAQNKCYGGELSLVSKETTYRDMPCFIN